MLMKERYRGKKRKKDSREFFKFLSLFIISNEDICKDEIKTDRQRGSWKPEDSIHRSFHMP